MLIVVFRLSLHQQFPELFNKISSVVHRVQVIRWGTVAKHLSVPQFLAKYRDSCALLFDLEAMNDIIAAQEEWVNTCSSQVLLLQKVGPLGDALFTSKIKDLVSNSLVLHIKEQYEFLATAAKADNTVCGAAELSTWREKILFSCEKNVQSLDLLPSRRSVKVAYRSGEIAGVWITCLADHIDAYIMGHWKGCAVAQEIIAPLEAEEMLTYESTPADKLLKMNPDLFAQALFFIIFILFFKSI